MSDRPPFEAVASLLADWRTRRMDEVAAELSLDLHEVRKALIWLSNRGVVKQVSIWPSLWRCTGARLRPVNGATRPAIGGR